MEEFKMDPIFDDVISELSSEEDNNEFRIDDDVKAEWATRKMEAEISNKQRLIDGCNSLIAQLTARKAKLEADKEHIHEYWWGLLLPYFESVEKRKTKTQESYELPGGGKLIRKHRAPKAVYDDTRLSFWLTTNEMTDYFSMKVNWGDLKKFLKFDGVFYYHPETGEICDLIKTEPQPDALVYQPARKE